ncbi:hypothetical protein PINS_up016950 [Pythium insidiosum]|nr:hypothetical protein PINS_up016950 [Pythium insidiosum]
MGPQRFRFRRDQSQWIGRQLREYRKVPRDKATWRLLHDAYLSAFPDDEPCSLATYQGHFKHLEQKEAMERAQRSVNHEVQSNRNERYGAQAAARAALVAATTTSSAQPPVVSPSFMTPTRGKRARPIDLSMDDVLIKEEPSRDASMTPIKLKRTATRVAATSFPHARDVVVPAVRSSHHSDHDELRTAASTRRPLGKQPPLGKPLYRRPYGYPHNSSSSSLSPHVAAARVRHRASETRERQTMYLEDLRSTLVHRDAAAVDAEKAARQWRREYIHIRDEAASLRAQLKQQQLEISDLERRVLTLESGAAPSHKSISGNSKNSSSSSQPPAMTSHVIELPIAGHGVMSFTLNIQVGVAKTTTATIKN